MVQINSKYFIITMKYFKLLQDKHCIKLNNFDILTFKKWYINEEQRNKLETFQYSNFIRKMYIMLLVILNLIWNLRSPMHDGHSRHMTFKPKQ